MASGFKDGATDLDDLFMSYTSGTKAGSTGFKVGATDLADRYQAYTTGTKRGATGFKDGATDLADIFQSSAVPLISILNPWYSGNLSNTAVVGVGTAKAGFDSFTSTGSFTRWGITGSTLDTYLSEIGTGNGAGFYIRRTTWTGDSVTTNLTTSWQELTSSYWLYLTRTILGSSSASGSIAIATSSSGANEVVWTGTLTCFIETDN